MCGGSSITCPVKEEAGRPQLVHPGGLQLPEARYTCCVCCLVAADLRPSLKAGSSGSFLVVWLYRRSINGMWHLVGTYSCYYDSPSRRFNCYDDFLPMCSSIWYLVTLYLLVFVVLRRRTTWAAFNSGSFDGMWGGNQQGFRSSRLGQKLSRKAGSQASRREMHSSFKPAGGLR